jgi:beta-phosphoglucomutase
MIKIAPKAFFFDFDGVICDTEKLHCLAIKKAIEPDNIPLSEKYFFEHLFGIDDAKAIKKLFTIYNKELTAEHLQNILINKHKYFLTFVKEQSIFCKGIHDLFLNLSEKSIPMCIVSCSRVIDIEECLNIGDLKDFFQFVIGNESVTHCKPDPEGYLKAFHQMKSNFPSINIEDCWALEDSPSGIKSAKGAGLNTIGITNSTEAKNLKHADHVISHYTDIALCLTPHLCYI